MIVVYSPGYCIDIGTHVFPTRKYQLVHDRIRAATPGAVVIPPQPASWEQLATVHSASYLAKLQTGDFAMSELALLEIPWSARVVEGFRLMTGGTLEAAQLVLELPQLRRRPATLLGTASESNGRQSVERRWAFHIGGGFHHAFADHGEGFCMFNDVAVALGLLFSRSAIERAAVIDLDVHHGNGTAHIFRNDARVFTFSMHQEHNYPADKPRGTLDVGVADRTGDDDYLELLRVSLPRVVAHRPQIAFYLAGADPYHDDQLGGLALTKEGLRRRDRLVLDACAEAQIPLVILLAGGYARRLEDTVDIHYATYEEAAGSMLV
jgi:acetoin utilization deacetylase AcuC-like enzyme